MKTKKFKNIVDLVLKSESFSKKGNSYYVFSEDVICVVGLQKSNYSNFYYFNIGYFIRQLDPLIKMPKEIEGHIRGRMVFKDVDYLDLDKLQQDDVKIVEEGIRENVLKFIKEYLSIDGIKKMLSDYPVMLYQTTVKAKLYLGHT
ncbi:MAG TPA: DUF4304 domain-containing protein [Chitinophagaceae bacterium]|jgi:hypothetical protein|nr:DUF4304 domain-containing protein [Chitinophagaceae bacterium]